MSLGVSAKGASAALTPQIKTDLFAGITKDDVQHAMDRALYAIAGGASMKQAAGVFLCSLTASALKNNFGNAKGGDYQLMSANAQRTDGKPDLNASVLWGAASAIFKTGMNISMGADPGKELGSLVGKGMAAQPALEGKLEKLFEQTWKSYELGTSFKREQFAGSSALGGAGSHNRLSLLDELHANSQPRRS